MARCARRADDDHRRSRGDGADPTGAASRPLWEKVVARELYSHAGDDGSAAAGEAFEWENLADDVGHADVVAKLHEQLVEVVKKGIVKPVSGLRPA